MTNEHFRKAIALVLTLAMLAGITVTTIAQSSIVYNDAYSAYSIEEIQPDMILETDTNCELIRESLQMCDLSHILISELSPYIAFELFRAQAALTIGMDFDTYMYGDVGTWLDDYLYWWRRENGITVISYEGSTFVSFNPETGLSDVFSAETQELIYSLYRCDDEFNAVRKAAIIRAPHTFYSGFAGGGLDVSFLDMLMYDVLGISSVEDLVDTMPNSVLESVMGRLDASRDAIDPFYYIGEPPQLIEDRRVTNTTSPQYSGVARVTTTFNYSPDGRYVTLSATGFLVSPRLVVTAGHLVYDFRSNRGWARTLEVRPGQNGSLSPFGVGHIHNATVGGGWWFNGQVDHDWGIVALHNTFPTAGIFTVRQVSQADIAARRIDPLKVIGYPHRRGGTFMYTSTGGRTRHNAHGHNYSFIISSRGGSGYSGAPVLCSAGFVVGIIIGGHDVHEPWVIRISQNLVNVIQAWR